MSCQADFRKRIGSAIGSFIGSTIGGLFGPGVTSHMAQLNLSKSGAYGSVIGVGGQDELTPETTAAVTQAAQRVAQTIETVAGYAPDTLDAGLFQRLCQLFRYGSLCHVVFLLLNAADSKYLAMRVKVQYIQGSDFDSF